MWRRALLTGAVGLAACAGDPAGDRPGVDVGGDALDAAAETGSDVDGRTEDSDDLADVVASDADASEIQQYEDRYVVCETLAVPSRFDAGWERMNHRISRLGFRPAQGADPCAPERWDLSFVGGDFTTGGVATDGAQIVFEWQQVALVPGRALAAVVPIELTVPPGGLATGRVSLRLDGRFDGLEHVVALVGGFHLETDVEQGADYPSAYDPALGYTSRGYGVGLTASRVTDLVHVDWELRFEHGVAFDSFIRPDMNAAIPHAVTGGRIEVIVVAFRDASDVAEGAVDWLQRTEEPYRSTQQREPDLPEDERTVHVPMSADAGTGFVGLGAFHFRLHPPMDCVRDTDCDMDDVCGPDGVCALRTGLPGDYVRQLAVGVEPRDGVPADGTRALLVTGYASTASEAFAFRPLHNLFDARVVLAALGDGPRYRFQATQAAGTRTISRSDAQER